MWNGLQTGLPNWSGNRTPAANNVGNLYIIPDPPTIEENPSIGLEGRNVVELPRAYKNFAVKDLTAETINGSSADITKWSIYPAIHDIVADLDGDGKRVFNISAFQNVSASNFNASATGGTGVLNGTISADVSVSSSLINALLTANVGSGLIHNGTLNVYGGTNLDGGDIRGTTIGCLPTIEPPIVNTIRFEVLPSGIFATTLAPLPIEISSAAAVNIQALGASTLTAGGVVSIGAGTRVEIDTSQIRCKNSISGADYTDLYVGNLHPAIGGSLPLRINDANTGQGVEINNGTTWTTKDMNASRTYIPSYVNYNTWNSTTLYSIGTNVFDSGLEYKQQNYATKNLQPSVSIPTWVSGQSYAVGNVVNESSGAVVSYICILAISPSTITPSADPTHFSSVASNLTSYYWALNPEPVNRDSIIFNPYGTDTLYYSFYKPYGSTSIWIVERNVSDNSFVRAGEIYDTTINPISTLPPLTGDLNMNGYNIVNVAGISNGLTGYITIGRDLLGQHTWGIREFNNIELNSKTGLGNATLRFKTDDYITTALELSTNATNSANITMNAPNGDLLITSTYGTLKLQGVSNPISILSDTNLNGNSMTGIDYIGLNYGRFAIPSSPNFNWFRWYGSYFSYSVDNGTTWTAIASDWSNFPALTNVDMGNHELNNVNAISGYSGNPVVFHSNVNMNGNTISNVNTISGNSGNPVGFGNDIQMNFHNILGCSTVATNEIVRASGSSPIAVSSALDLTNNYITGVNTISGYSTNAIVVGSDLNLNNNNLTNVNTINTRNIFQFFEFVNSGNITLTSNTPTRLPFNTTSLSGSGFSLNGNGDVVCSKAGTYRVILTTNVSKTGGGTSQVDIWYRQNGTDVSYSNQQVSITNASGRSSVITDRMLTFAVNDVLTCMFASSDANVSAVSSTAQVSPYAHPSSPSVCINLVCV